MMSREVEAAGRLPPSDRSVRFIPIRNERRSGAVAWSKRRHIKLGLYLSHTVIGGENTTRRASLHTLFRRGSLYFDQNHASWLLPFIHGIVARPTYSFH